MMMSDLYCPDCKHNTELVFDLSAGNTMCSECGLVLEAHSVDQTSEWRTFAGEHDPSRVDEPVNLLLGDAALSTVISNGSNADLSLSRLHNTRADRAIEYGFDQIAIMADSLHLVPTIRDRATEIYIKLIGDQKLTKGRRKDSLVGACVYIACRLEGNPRTVNEISDIIPGGTSTKLRRAIKFIDESMKMMMGTIHAEDYVNRFCSNLGMTNEDVKAVQETVEKSREFDIRRSPTSVAAAVIFMITQLTDSKKVSQQDISIATKVSQGTIKNAYRDLYPHAAMIIPEWYLKDRDINHLSS